MYAQSSMTYYAIVSEAILPGNFHWKFSSFSYLFLYNSITMQGAKSRIDLFQEVILGNISIAKLLCILVKVILQGACSGCPSSTFTLKSGIEAMLKEMLAGRVEIVEAING